MKEELQEIVGEYYRECHKSKKPVLAMVIAERARAETLREVGEGLETYLRENGALPVYVFDYLLKLAKALKSGHSLEE